MGINDDLDLLLQDFPAKRQGASANELHAKAARKSPFAKFVGSMQDPVNHGHVAQYSCRAPPARATIPHSKTNSQNIGTPRDKG